MPTRIRTRVAALLLPAALGLTACGGGGAQDSPQALTAAAYRHIAAGEFAQVCDLYLPSVRSRFANAGTDCQTYLAGQYAPGARATFKDPAVDGSKVRVNGDTAVIPVSAVSFAGQPSHDTATRAARQDGKWWLTG